MPCSCLVQPTIHSEHKAPSRRVQKPQNTCCVAPSLSPFCPHHTLSQMFRTKNNHEEFPVYLRDSLRFCGGLRVVRELA